MAETWKRAVAAYADDLLSVVPSLTFPVDLGKLATKLGVRRIRFRPMPVDGALQLEKDGYEVYLRSNRERCVPVADVDSAALAARVRFSYAHELVHIFFHSQDFSPGRNRPRGGRLESLCHYGARCLLIPKRLLENEIGLGRRFNTTELAFNIAEIAGTSATVVVRRMDEFADLKEQDYALLVLEPGDDGRLTTRSICLSTIFSALPRPALFREPPAWVRRFAPGAFSGDLAEHRVPYDWRWDFVSRAVRNPRRTKQLLVEIGLDFNEPTRADLDRIQE